MQRQDGYQITRTDMLLFIAQLLSLADAVIRIVAQCRTIDGRLLHSFARSEIAMLIVLGGIASNTNTRGMTPGLNDIIDLEEPPDRHAELLRIGASFQQIAMTLAMLLAMNPRAFRDRQKSPSFLGRHSSPSFRGREAEPGIQRWEASCLALGSMTPAMSSALHHSISGFRVRLRRPGMTPYLTARGPP
jgi:hypothetical protein